jgi:hypothetical protein
MGVDDPAVLGVRTLGGDQVELRGMAEGRVRPLIWTTDGRRRSPSKDSTLSLVETVLQHKQEIVKCVREQKARRPDLEGTVVMRLDD